MVLVITFDRRRDSEQDVFFIVTILYALRFSSLLCYRGTLHVVVTNRLQFRLMMMSAREIYPDQNYDTDHEVVENPTGEVNASTAKQQSERNIHKLVNDDDDSFEHEHRNGPAH
jgi:hypothetical protein